MGRIHEQADALWVARMGGPGTFDRLAVIGTIPGVVTDPPVSADNYSGTASDRCGSGKGAIRSERDGRTLSFRAPGSGRFGPPVDCYVNGLYVLADGEDAGKYLIIKVHTAYLSPTPVEAPVYIQDRYSSQFQDINAAQAAAGVVTEFAYFVQNLSNNVLSNVRGWVDPSAPYIKIRQFDIDPTFTRPETEAASILLAERLEAGVFVQLDIQRTIPPGTAANPKVAAWLHFRFDGP